jgi:UDP-glucuronate 4-epimerase
MNFLVTGGAGFIGSSFIDRLLSGNDTVICFDNFDVYYDPAIKKANIRAAQRSDRFQFIEGDICNPTDLQNCFIDRNIDVVIHLAARAGVRASIQNPELCYRVNVMGTLQVLEMMKSFHVKKMIFASSSSIYGNNEKTPFSEIDPVDKPISPYAASKKAGELLCHTYHHLYGFEIFCLRFFTVYGPRQRPDLAIHKFARHILNGQPIPFYGDGNTSRDYTYIDDIIDGILGAINNLEGYQIINLGESRIISLSKMVSTLEQCLGKKALLQKLPLQPGDVEKTYADISKAKKLLGYNPRYSFEEGIKNFYNWLDTKRS